MINNSKSCGVPGKSVNCKIAQNMARMTIDNMALKTTTYFDHNSC